MECTGYKTNRNLKESTWELGIVSPWPQLPEKSFLPFQAGFGMFPSHTQLWTYFPQARGGKISLLLSPFGRHKQNNSCLWLQTMEQERKHQ